MDGMESEIRRGHDTRICACCERSLPDDIDLCFECLGYRNFKPSEITFACNTPLCPTKKDGMKLMTHPGTNKQTYKCPGCECEVVVIDKKSEPSGERTMKQYEDFYVKLQEIRKTADGFDKFVEQTEKLMDDLESR